MRALSIRQPWAWLICHGYKDVENRTWNTHLRGSFLVHAGATFDRAGYEWVQKTFPEIPMPARSAFELGGIVGIAELIDCLPPGSDTDGTFASRWYMGDYGFLLANAKPLTFLRFKGVLKFFEVEYELSAHLASPPAIARYRTRLQADPRQACLHLD